MTTRSASQPRQPWSQPSSTLTSSSSSSSSVQVTTITPLLSSLGQIRPSLTTDGHLLGSQARSDPKVTVNVTASERRKGRGLSTHPCHVASSVVAHGKTCRQCSCAASTVNSVSKVVFL